MRVVAVIPAKGTSTRVPNKNLRPFAGTTLVGHKIDTLKACQLVDEVVVGSDDDRILAEAKSHGASVRRRDLRYCDESLPLQHRLHHLIAMVEADVILWAHCTNPLVGAYQYDTALRVFKGLDDRHDSLCSVTPERRHAWLDGKPINFDPWSPTHQLAADLPPVLHQNGAIFIQPREQMLDNRYLYGRKPYLFELDEYHGLDIDTEYDLWLASTLYAARGHTTETPA